MGTESGGCMRLDAVENAPILYWYNDHLHGVRPLGIYPLVYEPSEESSLAPGCWVSKFGAVDIDVKSDKHSRWDYATPEEGLIAARNLVTACAALGWTAWIERTRNGGFHIWSFAEAWVPAATMRRAQLVACALAEVPTSEVNPKSEGTDDPLFLSNYVNLPMPGALA